MTREEAINIVRNIYQTDAEKEALQALIPELNESEDERIRKELYAVINDLVLPDEQRERFNAWLEKQKEQKKQNTIPSRETILGIWELGNFWKENPEARDGLTQLRYIQKYWNEKCDYQKEQKPAGWSDTDNIGWDEAFACVTRAEKAAKNEEELQNAVTAEKWLKEIKFKYYVYPVKQEWSEEDSRILYNVIAYIGYAAGQRGVKDDEFKEANSWLKSLRPQSKGGSK